MKRVHLIPCDEIELHEMLLCVCCPDVTETDGDGLIIEHHPLFPVVGDVQLVACEEPVNLNEIKLDTQTS